MLPECIHRVAESGAILRIPGVEMLACLRVMRYTSLTIFPQYNKEFERYIYGLDALTAQFMIT